MQAIRFHEWLIKDESNARASTAETLARQATIALGFPVSTHAVAAMKRELGWSDRGTKKGDRAVQILAGSVRLIMQELNITVPQQLAELCE